jgi:UPF0755 protein
MDIKPPSRPPRPRESVSLPKPRQSRPVRATSPKEPLLKVPEELLESGDKRPLLTEKVKTPGRKKWWILGGVIALIVIIIAFCVGALWWYNDALQPKSASNQRVRVVIETGSTPEQIAKTLEEKGVIKSSLAFQFLIKQSGDRDKLQAGKYLFTPTQSSREVLDWLVERKVDVFNLTILPGQTLADIKQKLEKDGFAAADVEAAFTRKYSHPLLADKPDSVNLEGYIYPDTYQISSETTAEQLLTMTFDTFYKHIQDEGLQAKLTAHGFNMHQGVTLASIVEKEVSNSTDRRQVAQVFEKRLGDGMALGSDVTYVYGANLVGQTPRPDFDSPYNTRIQKGLPPGAIANFTMDALEAVADPAPGDYLFFVAGDDGTTHFAHTNAEHDANVKKYCTKLCSE